MKRQSTETPDKPLLDEGAFQQLLSAAFVLQQHKQRLQESGAPQSAFGHVLTRVVEIQEQIRNHRLDLQAAATLVARRIREITEASGAAVGILEGSDLEYFAATGSASGEVGARAPFELSLTAECVHTGLVLRCPDAEVDARLRPELCRPLNVRALIAVPILFETKVAGVLELHFARANSFQEQDVRACQLLAALLAEAVAREKDTQRGTPPPPQHSLESPSGSDTASMRAALEKIKPQLERLAGTGPASARLPVSSPPTSSASSASSRTVCVSCGHPLGEDESFCGACGTSRQAPSTWGSLWNLQREAEKSGKPKPEIEDHSPDALEVLPSELEDIVAQFSMGPDDLEPAKHPRVPDPSFAAPTPDPAGGGNGRGSRLTPLSYPPSNRVSSPTPSTSATHFNAESESFFPSFSPENTLPEADDSAPEAELGTGHLAYQTSDSPWTSAAKTQAWLETEHGGAWLARKWQKQRANIYLAAAAALLLAVLFGWGTAAPPLNTANATATSNPNNKGARRKAPPKPELSASDKLLVDLGLAEAPPAPAYTGNPDAKVWIDVHTALYYCPGSDFYGKTPGGRFTSQGDAQQDNFQPASRRACD